MRKIATAVALGAVFLVGCADDEPTTTAAPPPPTAEATEPTTEKVESQAAVDDGLGDYSSLEDYSLELVDTTDNMGEIQTILSETMSTYADGNVSDAEMIDFLDEYDRTVSTYIEFHQELEAPDKFKEVEATLVEGLILWREAARTVKGCIQYDQSAECLQGALNQSKAGTAKVDEATMMVSRIVS